MKTHFFGMPVDRMELRARLCLGAFAAIVGCSGGDSTSPPPGGGGDVWATVEGRSWSMPGESEGFVCRIVQASSDEYFTGFRLASPSSAQAEVLLTVANSSTVIGDESCSAGAIGSRLIYASAHGTTPLEFPAGMGVHVAAGQYLVLNIHVVNGSSATASDSTIVEGRVGTASDVMTPLEMIMAGTFQINLPSDGQTHTATGSCHSPVDQHFVALLPTMRARATHQTLSVVSAGDTTTLLDTDFDVAHDEYSVLTPAVHIALNAQVRILCSYVNNTGSTIQYGEASQNESCFTGIYRYPVVSAPTSPYSECTTG